MIRLAALVPCLIACSVPAVAEEGCRSPPMFNCADWHRDSAGRLASTKPVSAGLIEVSANTYLGDHTIIDGIDYAEALQKQCGR